ncbi:MAG: RHS repeat-associated core domain-containing protein, partial [Acutalibacteraceae bacterium]
TVGTLNPFRYRGYCYDTETGLYYLNSRYYDPITQRFVNADSYVTTGQGILAMNMFSYCGNSPILRTDPSGGFWITTFFIATLVIATVAVVSEIGYKHLEKSNYRHNSRVDNNKSTTTRNKIINDQNGTTGKNFNYGVRKAEKNGCEPIALHNAKVLTGKESTLSDTMKSFSEAKAMVAFGIFGSDTISISTVLEREGISYSLVRDTDDMSERGVYIVSYWTGAWHMSSIHTIAISYDGSTYTAYNYRGVTACEINLNEIKDSYICGYRVY